MKFQRTNAPGTDATASATMSLMGRPASTMTMIPDAAISNAVPRSGWRAIKSVGTMIMTAINSSCPARGGKRRSCRYHAVIMGTPSFMISEG